MKGLKDFSGLKAPRVNRNEVIEKGLWPPLPSGCQILPKGQVEMWSDHQIIQQVLERATYLHTSLPPHALFPPPLAHLVDSYSLFNVHLPTTPATECLLLWAPSWHSLCSNDRFPVCLFHWTVSSSRTRAFSFTGWVFNKCLWTGSCEGLILSCYVCTRTMGRNDFLILLMQGRSANLNMDFSSGSHTSKETMRQDGVTPSWVVKGLDVLSHEEKQKDGNVQPGKEEAWPRTQEPSFSVWENDRVVPHCLGAKRLL